jgi:NAD(P)-dependent dehydrogenase (short-subunit alcohol dehydrogenase family)
MINREDVWPAIVRLRRNENGEEVLGLVEGKTCIVTGGAGSLGLASASALLAEGAKVMLVDLDADKLAGAVRDLGTNRAAFIAADVTDAAQTRK